MFSKEVCLFTKYVGDAVDNPDSKTYFSYQNLLRRCTCVHCMEEKKLEKKEYMKKWRELNKDRIREYQKQWRKTNKEHCQKYYEENKNKLKEYNNEYQKQWNKKNSKRYKERIDTWRKKNLNYTKNYRENCSQETKNKIKKCKKKWYERNKDKMKKHTNEYLKKRRKTNPQVRLNNYFSSRMRYSLKKQGSSKKGYRWETLIGYTIHDLMEHLEQQFIDGMTWDNYGKWHVDHIKPISSFQFISFEDQEFQECWALNNLQPLWAQDNIKKSNKIL